MTIPFFIMENVNPPPTLDLSVLPTALCAKVVQELDELQAILAYIGSRLENIKQFLNDSDDDSDDGEVLNELEEYGNARKLCRKKIIYRIDGDDLAFPCPEYQVVKRTPEELRDVIMVTVRLKLLSCKFKISAKVISLLDRWKMPRSFRLYVC
ncbi:hypothetical protein Tco_1355207 [Tanacetum coccineum]